MHETNTQNPIDFPHHPFEDLLYSSGLIAQGGWDELDPYQQECVKHLVQLTARDCATQLALLPTNYNTEPQATVELNAISDCIRTILERYHYVG